MTCDQELCPFWDGHGCPCSTLDISDEERTAAKAELDSWLGGAR